MKDNLILIGGGGHCRACIDVIEQQDLYTIGGILDIPKHAKHNILGYAVIGTDTDIPSLAKEGYHFLITIGQIKSAERRVQLGTELTESQAEQPVIISPHAYVSPHAQIGPGSIIMHGAIINAAAVIGRNCIINTRAIIEHDAYIADHCHISTNAVVNGGSHIQKECFIGSQTMIREGVEVGAKSIIGAGTTILHDIPSGSTLRAKI